MDNLYWHEDKTHISHEELVSKLNEIMTNDTWIIDGNYISTLELRTCPHRIKIYATACGYAK